MRACAWTDGSNGRSQGPAGAAAYVIANYDTKEIVEEKVELFPHPSDVRFTNNDMEMTAILLAIQASLRLGVEDLTIHSDSEWAVKILRGEYRLRDQKFKTMVEQIHGLAEEFGYIELRHIRRESNSRADWLCTTATKQKRARVSAPQVHWTQ